MMQEDPFGQFADWWGSENVPVVVATAGPDGRPTARAVVLELFEPLLPHAASITTTAPDRTSRNTLIVMGGEVTASGQYAQ